MKNPSALPFEEKLEIAKAFKDLGVRLFQASVAVRDHRTLQADRDAVHDVRHRCDDLEKSLFVKMADGMNTEDVVRLAEAIAPEGYDHESRMSYIKHAKQDAKPGELDELDAGKIISQMASLIGYFAADAKPNLSARAIDTIRDRLELGALSEQPTLSEVAGRIGRSNRMG